MTTMQSLRERSGKARRKAIFAGLLYLIGIIGLAVVAFMPLTNGVEVIGYGVMNVTNFWKPIVYACTDFKTVIADPAQYIRMVLAGVLYGLMLVFTVINALRAFSKLDHLRMKGNRRAGFNQNKLAVDKMGNIFSCSYALVTVHTAMIMAMYPAENAAFTLTFLIATAAFWFIHWICGPIVGSISTFTVRDTVAEMPRKYRSFAPFLRNVLQVAAIGGIAFFMQDYMLGAFGKILTKWANPVDGWNTVVRYLTAENIWVGLFALLALGFYLAGFICYFVIFRHAANNTEFHACGKDKGRKVVRFWGFNLFLVLLLSAIAPVVAAWIEGGAFPANVWEIFGAELNLLYATAIALGLFIIECMLGKRPKLKKCYMDENAPEQTELVYDVPEAPVEKAPVQAVAAPVQAAPVAAPAAAPVEAPKKPAKNLPLSPKAQAAKQAKAKWIEKGLAAREAKKQSK